MTKRTRDKACATVEFSPVGKRVVQAQFDGGSMTSDAGVMLLSEVDRKLGLIDDAAAHMADPRDPLRITHSLRDMLVRHAMGLNLPVEALKAWSQNIGNDWVRNPESPSSLAKPSGWNSTVPVSTFTRPVNSNTKSATTGALDPGATPTSGNCTPTSGVAVTAESA
jgi:hypothetical protein